MIDYLITGTGRCGTKTVGLLFDHAGVPCGHEHYFKWGGGMPKFDDNRFRAESSWLAAPLLPKLPPSVTVIHIARNPRDTIEALHKQDLWGNIGVAGYYHFVRMKLPSLDNYDNSVDKTFHFYIEWNKLIEPYADHFFRIDRDDPEELLDALGIVPKGLWWGKSNQGQWPRMRFEEMNPRPELQEQFGEMAARYGY